MGAITKMATPLGRSIPAPRAARASSASQTRGAASTAATKLTRMDVGKIATGPAPLCLRARVPQPRRAPTLAPPPSPASCFGAPRGAEGIKGSTVCRAAAEAGAPTSVEDKSWVKAVVLPCSMALLMCNVCRICLSVAILPIASELSWGPATMGLVQSSFLWGYMLTQIPGGVLADKMGGKKVLGTAILVFCASTCLLPLALSAPAVAVGIALPLALAARILVGLGEGVAMPSMNNLVSKYVPASSRSTGLGGVYMGFHAGNIVGLVISPLLVAAVGWRGLFFIVGGLGVPLWLLWQALVPEAPEAGVGAGAGAGAGVGAGVGAGAAAKDAVGIRALLGKRATWAIIAANFVNHFGYFLYLNWMPAYFNKVIGLDLKASAAFAFVPWLVMAMGSMLSGVAADGLVARGVPTIKVRKGFQVVSFLGPAACLMLLQGATSATTVSSIFTAALAFKSVGQSGFIANMGDIAPTHAGKLLGIANTAGSFAGILSTGAAGLIVQYTGSWQLVFQTTAALYVVGAAIFAAFATSERQF